MKPKVGDRIRVLKDRAHGAVVLMGDLGTINSIFKSEYLDPDKSNGYGVSMDRDGVSWSFQDGDFEVVKSEVKAPTKEPFEFQIGDIVESFGVLGKVIRTHGPIRDEQPDYPIVVEFERSPGKQTNVSYTEDGLMEMWHKIPSLKFVSRPKKKIKKIFYTMIFNSLASPVGYSTGPIFSTVEMCMDYHKLNLPIVPIQIEVEE